MSKSYTIAGAKNLIGRLVHEAEGGERVEITRRGRPVAYVVGARELARLERSTPDFWQCYERFRQSHELEHLAIDPTEVFAPDKDPSPGRDFSW